MIRLPLITLKSVLYIVLNITSILFIMLPVNIHRNVKASVHSLDPHSGLLVYSRYALGVPVSPIDSVFKQRQSKWMREAFISYLREKVKSVPLESGIIRNFYCMKI